MRPYLEKTHHKRGLEEWFKVLVLSPNTSTTPPKKKTHTDKCILRFVIHTFSLVGLEFNSSLHNCKAGSLLPEPRLQFILLWLFCRWYLSNYLPGCPRTVILPISASQVARITGMRHPCLACHLYFKIKDKKQVTSFLNWEAFSEELPLKLSPKAWEEPSLWGGGRA
jgi:hypothetical protein